MLRGELAWMTLSARVRMTVACETNVLPAYIESRSYNDEKALRNYPHPDLLAHPPISVTGTGDNDADSAVLHNGMLEPRIAEDSATGDQKTKTER